MIHGNIKIGCETKEVDKGIKEAKKSLSYFGKGVDDIGKKLTKAFAFTAVLVGIGKISSSLAGLANDFASTEKKYRQLAISLGDSSGYEKIVSSINSLSRQTLYAKEDIESVASELSAMGKSADEIDKITKASVYLSNVTGKDLNSSMMALNNSTMGTTKALEKMGIDVSNLTKEQLENGGAIDAVIEKYGKLSEDMAKGDYLQNLHNMKLEWDEVKETLGGVIKLGLGTATDNLAGVWTGFTSGLKEAIKMTAAVFMNLPELARISIDLIEDMIIKLFEWVITSVKNLLTYCGDIITNTLGMLVDVRSYILKMVKGMLKTIGLLIANLGITIYNEIGDPIKDVLNDAIDGINAMLKEVWPAVSSMLDAVSDGFASIFNGIMDGFSNMMNFFIRKINGLIEKIPDWLKPDSLKNFSLPEVKSTIRIEKTNLSDTEAPQIAQLPKTLKTLENEIKDSFGDFGTMTKDLKNSLNDRVEKIGEGTAELVFNTREALHPFDDAIAEAGKKIGEVLAPTLEKIEIATDPSKSGAQSPVVTGTKKAVNEGGSEEGEIGKNVNTIADYLSKNGSNSLSYRIAQAFAKVTEARDMLANTTEGTEEYKVMAEILRKYESDFASLVDQSVKTDTDAEDTSSSGTDGKEDSKWAPVMNKFTDKMKESTGTVGELATNMATMGPVIGAIYTAVSKVLDYLKPVIETVLKPINDALENIFSSLSQSLIPVFEALQPILAMIGGVLNSSIGPILNSLKTPLSVITKIVEALTPVLNILMKTIVVVSTTIQWVINCIVDAVATIWNGFADALNSIKIFGKRLFNLSTIEKSGQGSLGSEIDNSLSAYENTVSGATGSLSVASGSTSTNASYTGGNTITINIYQEAPVVGDGGMRQFAEMVKEQFEAIAYYRG